MGNNGRGQYQANNEAVQSNSDEALRPSVSAIPFAVRTAPVGKEALPRSETRSCAWTFELHCNSDHHYSTPRRTAVVAGVHHKVEQALLAARQVSHKSLSIPIHAYQVWQATPSFWLSNTHHRRQGQQLSLDTLKFALINTYVDRAALCHLMNTLCQPSRLQSHISGSNLDRYFMDHLLAERLDPLQASTRRLVCSQFYDNFPEPRPCTLQTLLPVLLQAQTHVPLLARPLGPLPTQHIVSQ